MCVKTIYGILLNTNVFLYTDGESVRETERATSYTDGERIEKYMGNELL